MKGSRFNEEQIIGVLREHEAGAKTEGVPAPRDLKRDPLQVVSECQRCSHLGAAFRVGAQPEAAEHHQYSRTPAGLRSS
jgi:hypothetical protein